MNKVTLVGRLTRDPEIKDTDGASSVARFNVAVDRRYKREDGDNADFINCVAFGKTAEFIEKYFSKGKRIGLTGRIQTGSYTNNDGNKVYTTDVVVETAEFTESKSSNTNTDSPNTPADDDGFINSGDLIHEELPFNN